ncbi:MAG: dUTP diphosphatase [Ruminococcus sp.]|nr:dUTP diphosphatase [Ruminococcus sp.]
MKLKIKRLRANSSAPKRMTQQSAGADLFASLDKPLTVHAGQTEKVPTGVAVELDEQGYALLIFARSSLATKHGLAPANCVGVVDADYRGEIFVPLHNSSDLDYTITDGERIAQLVVMPVAAPEIVEVESLTDTERGSGGFGSTGKSS